MDKNKTGGSAMGMRHVQMLMVTASFMIVYVYRVNMSIAVVVMTNKTNSNPNFPEYRWSEAEKSSVLSSFFWGYILLQVVMGKLAEKYGAKMILTVAMALAALLNIGVWFAAPYGYILVCVLRTLQGVVQGAFMPCGTLLLSKWFSPVENSRAVAIAISGGTIGTVVAFPLCGYLASSPLGWPSIFYITGGMGLVWTLLWLWLGASSPSSSTLVSEAEKLYIESSLRTGSNQNLKKFKTPWRSIVTSKPVWAVFISHAGHNWGYWLLLTQLPNYMNSVMGVNIKKNGVLSALPYLSAWTATMLFSWIAVHVNKNYSYSISKTVLRKIFNTIGLCGCGLGFVVLALWSTDNANVVCGIIVTGISLNSAVYVGFLTNHLDISPNFCGTLTGITNSLANIASFFTPLTVGWMVKDVTSQADWKYVFFLAGGVLFVSNLIYLILGSAKLQSWNSPRAKIVKNYDGQKESAEMKEHGRQLL